MNDKLLFLQKQWRLTALLTQIMWALLAALIVARVSSPLYGVIAFAAVLPILLLVNKSWRLPAKSIVQYLNKTYPALEESTQLLLVPSTSIIQQLQQDKVKQSLDQLQIRSPFRSRFYLSAAFLVVALVFCFTASTGKKTSSYPTTGRKEIIPASIQSATITITPPKYTQLPPRRQQQFSLTAVAGAQVSWSLSLSNNARQVSLLFNDGTHLSMQASNGLWQASKIIRQPGFYQVQINDKLSELYSIEAVRDAPPVIIVQSPQPSVSIPFHSPQKFLWQSTVTDDYGLTKLQLYATIASGQGEGVKFRENKIALPVQANAKNQNVQHTLNCHALNMQPGDEVYLWLSAVDNYGQETRSDVYVVALQDTTGQITIDGLLNGLDVKPELFRSQRQIIIETEQLLRDRNKISLQAFQEKSNDLGVDQKLLRLRYGKFLGEEFSSEIGGDHHEEGTHNETKDEATAMMELYSHNHDNAEDASYFDPATKQQLKAMLTEMWNAELQLRTFLPKDALPYEYKALRLLKDLQQKSRAYVPKTTFTPTPLQMDKRLTGDLSKVNNTLRQKSINTDDPLLLLRKAIGVLEELKTSGHLTMTQITILHEAYEQLSIRAAFQPAVYLEALAAYRDVLNDVFTIGDIRKAQKGLQQMLPAAPALPYAQGNSGNSLQQAYFENLRKIHR